MSKKAAVITLGCAKNSVDSEHIKGSLLTYGIALTEEPRDADFIIINTCGFIEAAKQESIDVILELAELKAGDEPKKLVVTGCLAQRYYDELHEEIPEIDVLVDLKHEFSIGELLSNGAAPSPRTPSGDGLSATRDFAGFPERVLSDAPYAYLLIADGCDNRCSYCAIPMIRGPYKSKPLEQVVDEAKWLDGKGIKEINIIAQDIGRYGEDLYGHKRLTDLVMMLTGFTNVEWLRLLYLQPYNINDELISAIKGNKLLLPYLDIPFQHGSQKILRAMGRNGTGDDYLALIAWLRRVVPDVVLRTSVIVGFPGETDEDFGRLVEFTERAEFDYLGVFEYSPEEGTRAAQMADRVADDVAKERHHQLVALQDSISQRRSEMRVGKTFDVLIERAVESEEGLLEGRAWWQAPEVDGCIYVTGDAAPGRIVPVTVDEFDGCDFHGRVAGGTGE